MPHETGNQVKSLPVYDVSNYGTDVFLGIFQQDDNLSTIDMTNVTVTHQLTDASNFNTDPQDEIISNIGTLPYYHAGTDTEYDHTYTWHPDMTSEVYKTRVQIAWVLDVTARSAGTFDLTQVLVTIVEQPNEKILFSAPIPVVMAGLSAVGQAYFIMDFELIDQFKVYSGNPIEFRFITTVATGTGDFQTGIAPLFAYNSGTDPQIFTRSGITLHIHATLDHADPIFNEDLERIV